MSDEDHELQFTIRYDEAVMRSAVDTFMWRRLKSGIGALGAAAVLVTVAALVLLLLQGDRSWVVGVIGAALALFVSVFAAIWRWRHAEMRAKLDAIPSRQATVTLNDDSLTISSEAGSASLPFVTFTEVWKLERSWLLFLAPNNFVTLPTDGIATEVLQALEARLPATCTQD